MPTRNDWRALLLIFASPLLCMSIFPLYAFPLEGQWQLVEQHYETGSFNIMDEQNPLFLEFTYTGDRISGKIWSGQEKEHDLSWPAFVNDEGPLPVEIVERTEDMLKGSISVHYRVKPSREDDLILDIKEEYSVTKQGDELAGKMEVTFMREGSKKGSYVLHRRFARKDK